MCYSPCFIQATRTAFAQQQLLQCRTCGSQAFHILDCCRNPDYRRVPVSHLGERLKHWLGRVKAIGQAWRSQPRRRLEQAASPEALDLWETRPIVVINPGDTRAPQDSGAREAAVQPEHEEVSLHR
jgi:hypothetical protein